MGHYLYTPGCNFGKCCKPKSSATARGYVFGGSVSATANEEYETIGDSWASKTAVPAPGRASHTSTSLLAADAHCIGDGGHTADNDAYTVAADSWTSKTDLAYTLGGAAAETLSGKIYTAGGFKNGAPAGLTRNTDEYAPADSWTAKTDMPTPARAPGADASAAISTGMYLFGAASPSSTTATEEYIPDTWTTKTAMSSNRGPVSASTASDIAYVMGGIVSGTRQTTVESYVVDTWTAKTDMPGLGRNANSQWSIGSDVYITGGYDGTSPMNDVDKYTPDTWASLGNLGSTRWLGNGEAA